MTTFDPHPIYTELLNESRARGADPALPALPPRPAQPGETGEPDRELPGETVPA